MIEQALAARHAAARVRITVKTLVAAVLIALSVGLPQIVHLVAGPKGGMMWLPMYLPVLLAGCLLGVRWGAAVGILAPLVSFGLTSAAGNAMPALSRLPFMLAELAVFAAVSGLFAGRIAERGWMAFAAVPAAIAAGRLSFLALAALFQSVSGLSAAVAWSQILTGWPGVLAQVILAPCVVVLLRFVLLRERS